MKVQLIKTFYNSVFFSIYFLFWGVSYYTINVKNKTVENKKSCNLFFMTSQVRNEFESY